MVFVSKPFETAPADYRSPLQKKAYAALDALGIPYQRVDTDDVITMEDCALINEKLDMKTVKTLFLRNQQKTAFYVFITVGDKPFRSKDFSAALGVPRVSFASPEQMMELLGSPVGAATVFSCLLDTAKNVRFIVDKDVTEEEWFGCSDGTTRGYMKIRTKDVLEKLLPASGHKAEIAAV